MSSRHCKDPWNSKPSLTFNTSSGLANLWWGSLEIAQVSKSHLKSSTHSAFHVEMPVGFSPLLLDFLSRNVEISSDLSHVSSSGQAMDVLCGLSSAAFGWNFLDDTCYIKLSLLFWGMGMEGMGFGMNKMGGKLWFLICSELGLCADWAVCVWQELVCWGIITNSPRIWSFLGIQTAAGVWGGWAHPIKHSLCFLLSSGDLEVPFLGVGSGSSISQPKPLCDSMVFITLCPNPDPFWELVLGSCVGMFCWLCSVECPAKESPNVFFRNGRSLWWHGEHRALPRRDEHGQDER